MTKQIYIEVREEKTGGEKTHVDWSKNFTSINEVVVALQIAMGAVMQEIQKQVELQKKSEGEKKRPDFVPRRDN